MKKLKLESLQIHGAEILTRNQMKNVMGGGEEDGKCTVFCTGCSSYVCDSGCTEMKDEQYVVCQGTRKNCTPYPACWVDHVPGES